MMVVPFEETEPNYLQYLLVWDSLFILRVIFIPSNEHVWMGVIREREVKWLSEIHASGPLKWGKKLPLLFASSPEVTLKIKN